MATSISSKTERSLMKSFEVPTLEEMMPGKWRLRWDTPMSPAHRRHRYALKEAGFTVAADYYGQILRELSTQEAAAAYWNLKKVKKGAKRDET